MESTLPGQAWSQAPQPMQVASIQKCPIRVRAMGRSAYAPTPPAWRASSAASWAGARLPPLQLEGRAGGQALGGGAHPVLDQAAGLPGAEGGRGGLRLHPDHLEGPAE